MLDEVQVNSQGVMAPIDAMPAAWRALVHEYGRQKVLNLYQSGIDVEDAVDELWLWRSARQQQWLSTDYITPKVRRSFGMDD